jgi:hypothetical protein
LNWTGKTFAPPAMAEMIAIIWSWSFQSAAGSSFRMTFSQEPDSDEEDEEDDELEDEPDDEDQHWLAIVESRRKVIPLALLMSLMRLMVLPVL